MSEVMHNAQREFWRPPPIQPAAETPALVEACHRCGTEFMVGAHFCHVCGAAREIHDEPLASPGWTRYLEFHNIQRGLGLRTASLIAFFIGLGCVLAAVTVGFIYGIRSVLDWQAVQLYRIQWLLAAAAAFVAGILLKRSAIDRR